MAEPNDPRRGYAICTVARSGSTWLAELLAGTGVLGRPSEFFSTPFQRQIRGPAYPADRAGQVAQVLTEGATSNGIYGFKIYPGQVGELSQQLRWTQVLPNLRFIHFRRRDLLRQALSRLRAEQTQEWRSTLPTDRTPVYRGPAIRRWLHVTVTQDARWELFFARNGIEPLRLVYEDALLAPQATVDTIADLMELTPRPIAKPEAIGVGVQRDALTEDWRARFIADYGDLDVIDELEPLDRLRARGVERG